MEESVDVRLARIEERLDTVIKKLDNYETELLKDYVKVIEFAPVRNIVYGLVGLILIGFAGAIINFVMGS